MAQIPLSLSEIDLLFQDLEMQRKELEDDAIALARVKRMMLKRNSPSPPATEPVVAVVRPIDVVGVGFNEAVRRVARDFGESFTVPKIERVLIEHGVQMPDKPRQRIAMEIKKLCDAGEIVKVSAGAGNTPHVYKVA